MKKSLRVGLHSLANRLFELLQNAQYARLTGSLKSCGSNVSLYMPVRIDGAEEVEVGNNVAIAPFVHIWGGGGIRIGDGVMIGSHTAITSQTHDYHQELMHGTLLQKGVVIEENVWIGAHSVIMPGITIRKGAVIGAGSIVTKDVETNAIMIGAPARLLKYREISSAFENQKISRQ